MPRLVPERPPEVIRKLRALGFEGPHEGGKHMVMRHPATRKKISVPIHGARTLPMGTLRAIVREAGCTTEEWGRL
jgi:predicted RNA binding protein YcfA (HicA-like mRNA interferase family)